MTPGSSPGEGTKIKLKISPSKIFRENLGGAKKLKIMLTSKEKEKLIEKSKIHKQDTGSPEVQIALLTENIQKVLSHLKKHLKDSHSRHGLLKMVIKRKRLLKYLQKESPKRYNSILKKIGLKE